MTNVYLKVKFAKLSHAFILDIRILMMILPLNNIYGCHHQLCYGHMTKCYESCHNKWLRINVWSYVSPDMARNAKQYRSYPESAAYTGNWNIPSWGFVVRDIDKHLPRMTPSRKRETRKNNENPRCDTHTSLCRSSLNSSVNHVNLFA